MKMKFLIEVWKKNKITSLENIGKPTTFFPVFAGPEC